MKHLENAAHYLFEKTTYTKRRDFFSQVNGLSHFPDFISTANPPPRENLSFEKSLSSILNSLEKQTQDLYMLYSGGLDSEILLTIALKLGLNPIPIIVDLFGINRYELTYAKKFLKRHGVSNAIMVHVSEKEFFESWLPELVKDTESLSYILAGAYIGARHCPRGATILFSGENPSVITVKDKKVFYVRHEYSMWTQKVENKYDYTFIEPYNSPIVIKSYLSFPAIRQRLESPVPFDEWTADFESLGKEYLYNDTSFCNLERRFSQHGWEFFAGKTIYNKGMVPGSFQLFSSLQSKKSTLLDQNFYLNILLEHLNSKNGPTSFKLHTELTSTQFHKHFYVRIGNLYHNQLTFCDAVERTTTSSEGILIEGA